MRKSRFVAGPVSLGLMILVVLIASISLLAAGKSGNARQAQNSDGSFVQAVVDGGTAPGREPITFTHDLPAAQSAEDARDALVALIDAHPQFTAAATTPPPRIFEVDDVFYEVLPAVNPSGELESIRACETDQNYTNSGVWVSDAGRLESVVLKPTAVAGGGIFDLRFDMDIGPNFVEAFATSAGDVSGLISTITSSLTGAGFTVTDIGSELVITRPADRFIAARVESTDGLITDTCVELRQSAQSSLPTLHATGLLLLATGLLLAGILIIRRKATRKATA